MDMSTIMASLAKQPRSPVFSQAEKLLLVELLNAFKDIIENKRTDATTTAMKEKAWDDITKNFAAQSTVGVVRSTQQLFNCYKNLKHGAKKHIATAKVELFKTGGGPAGVNTVDDIDLKLISIMEPQFIPMSNIDSDGGHHDFFLKNDTQKENEEELVTKSHFSQTKANNEEESGTAEIVEIYMADEKGEVLVKRPRFARPQFRHTKATAPRATAPSTSTTTPSTSSSTGTSKLRTQMQDILNIKKESNDNSKILKELELQDKKEQIEFNREMRQLELAIKRSELEFNQLRCRELKRKLDEQ